VGSVFPCRLATFRISAMSLVYDQPFSSRAVLSLTPIGGSAMAVLLLPQAVYRESVAAATSPDCP
jgi:hypothetical protein